MRGLFFYLTISLKITNFVDDILMTRLKRGI